MADYDLVEPLCTDDGSLVGISPEEAFALGVEWEMFRQKLKTGRPFTDLCMQKNAHRLVAMVERHGRFVEDHPFYEGWSQIIVGGHLV